MALEPVSDPQPEVSKLLNQLEKSSQLKSKKGRAYKNQFQVWDHPDFQVTGWKFNEWDYFASAKLNLPIDARGLFTFRGKIVIRGYDKFFNIDEVSMTTWDWITRNTKGPYYLTSKENGCILFMSAVDEETLLVCSKHSTGPRDDIQRNHSWMGLKWVDKHLEKVGLTRQDLAKELYRSNITAVGELCDDEFEEHVLAYKGARAGIYLHGLNLNTIKFATHSYEQVTQFADKFGFFKTPYTVQQSLDGLQKFLDECKQTGSWNGIEVEGFVIRSKLKDHSDFFFKYKFEEPYLMYRNWREVTKCLLAGTPRKQIKLKNHAAVTNRYLDYVIPILSSDSTLRERFVQGHGIIELREKFLNFVNKSGLELSEEQDQGRVPAGPKKFVFMPVATIGCGKTTLAVSLTHLFDWGHIQNDEMTTSPKLRKTALVNGAIGFLNSGKPAVFVDRNNHMIQERKQLFDDMSMHRDDLIFICVNFVPHNVNDEVWNITRRRVIDRGDNHPTILASVYDDRKIEGIMKGFVSRLQPVDVSKDPDSQFDYCIDLDVSKGTRHNLEVVISELHKEYPELVPRLFSDDELENAMNVAMHYKPTVTKNILEKPSTNKSIAYFSLLVSLFEVTMTQLIDSFFAQHPDYDASFWNKIKPTLKDTFHVTLAHSISKVKAEKDIFKKMKLLTQKMNLVSGNNLIEGHAADVRVLCLGFNSRIMALEVEIVSDKLKSSNKLAHITIGMVQGAKPVESNDMLCDSNSTLYEWDIEPKLLQNQKLHAYV